MNLSLRQLEVFNAVAEAEHFGRAAAVLGLAQPTVSKEVRLLERRLGVPLFVRGAGGTRLTDAGRTLLPAARRVLLDAEAMALEARSIAADASSKIAVAASPSVVNRLLPAVLRTLEEHSPALEVDVVEAETGEVSHAVTERRADVGVGRFLSPVEGCEHRHIGVDTVHVVAHESLLPRVTQLDSLAMLEDVPLYLWGRDRNPAYHDAVLAICHAHGLDPLVLTGAARLSGARRYLLVDGRAFALVPEDFATLERAPLRAVPLSEPASVPLECLWRTPARDAVRTVVSAIKAEHRRRK